MNSFSIGTPLSVAWSLTLPDGTPFDISENYTVKLFYRTGRGETEVQSFTISATSAGGNTVTWNFAAEDQLFTGNYSLRMELTSTSASSTGPTIVLKYNDAFALVNAASASDVTEQQETTLVSLFTASQLFSTDHRTAQVDHAVATADHTTAGTDHETAQEDHNTATTDHTTAGTDHTQATTDHTTAGTDHTQATTDHTTAGTDHDNAAELASHPVYVGSDGHWYTWDLTTHAYVQGSNGPNVKAKYSSDGTSWHDAYASGDKYIKFSYDNGSTWGDSMLFAPTVADSVLTTAQSLTEAQKKQARNNIGAIPDTGEYPSLISGASKNLIGYNAVAALFTRRTSGGNSDIGTGTAQIKAVKGNTVVWNQLVGASTSSVTLISGHIYILNDGGTMTRVAGDGSAISVEGGVDNLFDLTLMFGAGNEPATVAEFRALFPLDYYAYNAGTVLGNKATKLLTDGFNQISAFKDGYNLNDDTGAESADEPWWCTDYVPVLPDTSYYFRNVVDGYHANAAFFYDADKNFISATYIIGDSSSWLASGVITTPSNCAFVRTKGRTFNGHATTCINLHHSGARDGDCEAYEEHELALNLATLTGKAGGTGSSVTIFADGMHGRGDVRDTLDAEGDQLTKATKRWEKRTYQSGDESDTTVITDGSTYTYYQLATPVEYTLNSPIDSNYPVNDYGVEWMLPENGSTPTTAPICCDVVYAINAIDTVRNINKNHPDATSVGNLLEALKTAGVISAYTMTYNATTGSYSFNITAAS